MATRQGFEDSLRELQQDILRMGKLVEEAIKASTQSLAQQDLELAEKVIAGDKAIDDLCLEIEDRCLKLIATQQPMARDLRRISVGLRIITDLERIGDYASDIARVTKFIGDEPLIKPLIDIPRMAELTQKMVHDCLEAYVREDVALAQGLAGADDLVDHLYSQVFRELLTYMMENPRTIKQATYLLLVSRYLERMADHATNIGESVIYLVTGERQDLNY